MVQQDIVIWMRNCRVPKMLPRGIPLITQCHPE